MTTRAKHRELTKEFIAAADGKGANWSPEWSQRMALIGLTHAVLALSADDNKENING